MRVSKDGVKFYDISDDPSEVKIAMDKGYKPFVRVTKDGSDFYDIEGTPEQMKVAESKGYMLEDSFRNLQKSRDGSPTLPKGISALAGATDAVTMGFDDELSGAMSGARAALKGEDPRKAYQQQRDQYRAGKEKAERDNPWTFGGSGAASSILTPAMGAANTAKGLKALLRAGGVGASFGAASAAGRSQDISEMPRDMLEGAITGGVLGAGGRAVAGGQGAIRKVYKGSATNDYEPITIPSSLQKKFSRQIKHNGEDMTHEIYAHPDGQMAHFLVNAKGEPMSELWGRSTKYLDDPGFAVEWSKSAKKGNQYGAKAYDLALDSHKNLFSDQTVSEKGAHKMYSEHFQKTPGVLPELADWGNSNRHRVYLHNEGSFRKNRDIPAFDEESYRAIRSFKK